jgi:hypothetical protein
MVGGFAKLGEHRVMVIGTQKGRDTKENILRNFGSAHPEGYRKALRLMRLANKFGLPIITLIDTAGAYPGVAAEERHIAEAIAVNLREMMLLEVPIIAAVIGEGGSGGALGIGVADRVLILENAYYSVISPEGCAAILWKDRAAAAKAAAALKITAKDLLDSNWWTKSCPNRWAARTPIRRRRGKSENASAQAPRRNSRAAGRRAVEKALRKIPRARSFHEKAEPSRNETGVVPTAGPLNPDHAVSLCFSAHFQGTHLGRTRAGTALRQKNPRRPAHWRIVGNQRPARRRQRHRQRPARRQNPALADGKPRGGNSRRRQTGGGRPLSRCSAKFSTRAKNCRCKSIRRRPRRRRN